MSAAPGQERRAPTRSDRHRVLLVFPNWLGDLIMALPLLDVLAGARTSAGAHLEVIGGVRRRWAPLLVRDPRLDGLVPYERTGRHAGAWGVPRLAAIWRAAGPDSVVITPPSLRMGLVARLSGIRRRVGYAVDGCRPFLTLALNPVRPRGRLHHCEELGLALLETLGAVPGEGAGCTPSLPGLDGLAPTNLGDGPPLWILAPGATYGPAKNWPVARVAEFVDLAVTGEGVRVAIVGDTTTTGFTAELRSLTADLPWRRELPGPAGIIDLVGGTTLVDLAALLRAAAAFVGNDSGVMHVSAALGVPTLGLFGSSSEAWTAPRGRRARAMTAHGFACQPCFRKTCNQPPFCLDTLSGRDVLAAVHGLLDGEAGA